MEHGFPGWPERIPVFFLYNPILFLFKLSSDQKSSFMIKHNSWLSKLSVVFFLLYAQESSAETFTNAKVLEWSEKAQNSLFQDSITMIGIVASQMAEKAHIARCINEWYGADEAIGEKRHDHIRSVMARYPDHHPQAIILAVVQKACGKFGP